MTADPLWGGVGAGGLCPPLQAQATRLDQCDGEKAAKEEGESAQSLVHRRC